MTTETLIHFLSEVRNHAPETFLVLGSGMGVLASRTTEIAAIPFGALGDLPASGVVGHRGRLTLASWAGKCVLLGEGRLHYYEGHSWEVVTRCVEFAISLGVHQILLTNAAGGIRTDLDPGTLLPLMDLLEFTNQPLRVPVRPSPFSPVFLDRIVLAAREVGQPIRPGVYCALTGPSYETPAEISALRGLGAHAVGMSTAREARRAAELGATVGAISLITNRAAGLDQGKLDHADVLLAGKKSADALGDLLERILTG